MKMKAVRQSVVLEGVRDFDLTHTFTCGQCFRWNQNEDGSFTGVAHGKRLTISFQHNKFTLSPANLQEFHEIWEKYFDLPRDYGQLKGSLSRDHIMRQAAGYGWGIRILRQDLWETLLSFILSANNNVPRIKQIIERLCTLYGTRLPAEAGDAYAFPTPEQLRGADVCDLAPLRAGYRAGYLVDAVEKVCSKTVDLSAVQTAPLPEARRMLLQIKGIGPKVADCILLFGTGRLGVFPVDTWVRQAMRALYPDVCQAAGSERAAGEALFGQSCGLAQQYLFYFARETNAKF